MFWVSDCFMNHYFFILLFYARFNFIMQNIVQLLDPLPIHLEPAALLESLTQLHHKGNTDNDTLGHAYYTRFYGKQKTFAQVEKPRASSLLSMFTPKQRAQSAAVNAGVDVVQLTPPTVYVASICDEVNSYVLMNGILPAHVFCQAIRDIHPHELRGTYYHDAEICGGTFDRRDAATEGEPYLTMVNRRLRDYFWSGYSLDDVLSQMKKCLCLRMLSNNMYYYRDHPDALDLDPAIQRLMGFYTLSGFLHASSQDMFDSHYHMILKYNQLLNLVEVCITPAFAQILHRMRCSFHAITRVESNRFEVTVRDDGGAVYALHPNTLPALQALVLTHVRPIPPQLSSTDMVHMVQARYSNPRTVFDEGIRFIKILMNRLKNYKTYKVPLKDIYGDLYQIYELTVDALRSLHEQNMHRVNDDKEFLTIMQKMDRYNQIYHRAKLNASMVDWSVAAPPHSHSPSKRFRSPSPSYSMKRRRLNGGAKSTAKKFTKTRKS
jgi:hypothetical protein